MCGALAFCGAASLSRAASPSGQDMPVGDILGWHQIYADDFTTNVALGNFPAAVSSKWSAYTDGTKDNSGFVYYWATRTVSIANGILDIYVHTENGQHLDAAIYPKISTFGQLYGRYSVRFRADALPGYGGVWLLWQDSNTPAWPAQGEIDFPEGNFNGTMTANAHYANAGGGFSQYPTTTTYSGWHTATTEWSPGKEVFILDDHVIGVSTHQVPSTSMHLVFQSGSSGGNPSDTVSGHIQVDWVTMYAPSSTATGPIPMLTYEAEGLPLLASSGDTVRDFTDSQMSNGAGSIIDATAAADYMTYMVPSVAAGTYTVLVGTKKYNTRGIFQLSANRADGSGNSSNVGGATDEYTSVATYPEINLGSWTPGSTSDKAFKFTVTGKNASSSGYGIAIDYIKLVPQ